jgi:glycosyltransferase involved in cell wall biosynthesis
MTSNSLDITHDVSVIIPACNEYPQIAFTLDSIESELRDIDHEVIVVFNNSTDEGYSYVANRGTNIRAFNTDSLSCWKARSFGAEKAKGETLFFTDAHVLIEPHSFLRCLEVFEKEDCGIVWMAMRYLMDQKSVCYGYDLKPEKFWGNWTRHRREIEPYPLVMSGAAGFAIKKKTFESIGGYHESLGIYGGGEPYLAFKAERLGFRNYIAPQAVFAHFNAKRKYAWNNDDLWRNFLLASYTTGGEEWLMKIRQHYFGICNGNKVYEKRLDEIVNEARALGTSDHLWIEKNSAITVNEIIARDLMAKENTK